MHEKTSSLWWVVYVVDPDALWRAFGIRRTYGDLFRLCPHWALGNQAHDLARGLAWTPVSEEEALAGREWDAAARCFSGPAIVAQEVALSEEERAALTVGEVSTADLSAWRRFVAWLRSPSGGGPAASGGGG